MKIKTRRILENIHDGWTDCVCHVGDDAVSVEHSGNCEWKSKYRKDANHMTALEIALAGYLVFGQVTTTGYQEIEKYGGLQVIHSDGAVTLRLEDTGRELMERGISVTLAGDYDSAVFELRRSDGVQVHLP